MKGKHAIVLLRLCDTPALFSLMRSDDTTTDNESTTTGLQKLGQVGYVKQVSSLFPITQVINIGIQESDVDKGLC